MAITKEQMSINQQSALRRLVRVRMRFHGLSYTEIARACGNSPSRSRISGWLAGKHDIAASSVESVLNAITSLSALNEITASSEFCADTLDDL
jgi:transcriptional regulator with XRE-family HTH domain